jgi:TP901 family phage tail tape measure protein
MAGQNLPIELEARLLTRAADAQAKALADRTQDRFSKIKIGFNGGSFKAGSAALGKISQDADQFEKSMAAANARVLAFGTAVGVIEGMRRSFLALVKTTTDVELALTKISVVAEKDLQKAGISIERVGKQIFDVAKQTGQSWQTAADTMLEFSRQGVKPAEALKRTRDALILSRISGIDYKEAVEGLTSTLNAFNKTGIDSTAVINKLVAVDNNAAASATDLIQGLQRMASTAQLTGQSIDDAVASIATLQEITFRGGPQIGNSLKSLAIRIYDPENIKYIESLGDGMTKIRDDSLNLLSAVEIIGNLGETIKKLPKEEQINVIKNIFGQYQTNAAASLIQGMEDVNNQLSIFNKNKQLSQNAGNDALSANAKLSEILSSKFNVLNVQIGELLNSFGKLGVTDPLSGFLDSVSWIVDNLKGAAESTDTLAQGFQFVTKVLGGAIFSKAGLAAITFIIGKIAKDFVAFGLEAGRSFLGLNRAARDQEAIQQSIAAYIQQSGQNLNVLLNSEQARLNLTKQIAAAWNQSVLSAQQMAAVTKQIAVPIFNSGLRASPTGPSRRAADGFVPLVNAEMNDVKRGVGGAAPNSKIVVMPNFPFGGGKRGMMVANSSETLVDYGGGKYGIMNPDMMAGRAASGFSAPKATIQNKKGRFVGGVELKGIEGPIGLLIELLVEAGASAKLINSNLRNFIGGMDLQAKSVDLLTKLGNEHAQSLKNQAIATKNAAIAQQQMAQAQAAFVKSGGPNLGGLNKGGSTLTSSPEFSGLGFRRPAYEGPIQGDPFGISNVYTPEKLEQIRKGKEVRSRLAVERNPLLLKGIDDKTRASAGAYWAKKFRESVDKIQKEEIKIGETKKRLTELQKGGSSGGGLIGDASGQKKKRLIQIRNILASRLKESEEALSGSSTLRQRFAGRDLAYRRDEAVERLRYFGYDPENLTRNTTRVGSNELVKQSELKARLEAKFRGRYYGEGSYVGGGGPSNPSGPSGPSGFKAGLATIDARLANQPSKKGFDSEAFNKFAAKAFLAAAAAEGLASSFMGASDTLDGYLKAGSTLVAGGSAIGTFEQLKELDFSSIGEGFEKSRAGKFGGKFVSVALGGVRAFASALPIIGQIGIGLATLNSIIEDVTGKSGLQRLKEAFGGLTEEAEKSAQAFKENAQTLFDASGKAILRTLEEVSQGFKSRLEIAQRERFAQSKGINTKDKSQQDIQNELLGKRIDELLGATKTGGKKEAIVGGKALFGGTGGAYTPIYGIIDETLGNINSSVSATIKESLQLLSNQTESGLREFLSSKGVSKISGEDIKNAGLDKLQDEVYRLFLENIVRNIEPIKRSIESGRGRELMSALGDKFYAPLKESSRNIDQKTGKPIPTTPLKVSQERVENLLEVKFLEQEILTLEELSIKTQLRTGELTDLEAAKREAMLRVLESERTERQKVIDLVGDSVRTYGKADLAKNVPTSALTEIEKKIQSFNGDAEQARALVQEIAASFAPDKAKELVDIFESGNRKLEAQKKTRADILKQTNDQAIKEAGILQTLERQRGLVQAKLSLDQSQRSLQRGARENEASALEARASGVNVGVLESESLRRQALRKRQENIPSLIQDIQDEHENQLLDLNKKLISSPEDKSIGLQIQALNNATQERIDALKAESAALDENIRTLGEIPGFLKEFGDQLVNFEKSLPSSAAQNKFNLLQSTDAQSRIGGLISQQVFRGVGITEPPLSSEDQSRANLAAQISDQNALLLEQSKIRTAVNASEKLELETQYELTKQILEIKKQGLSPLEEQLKIEQAINANLKDRQTFGFGVRQASAEAQTRMQNFSSDFGKTAFDGFRDGLSDAIKAAVSQTDNLKSALLDVALAFANKLRDKAIDNLADVISNSLFSGGQSKSSGGGIVSGIVSAIGGFFGGGVQKRATGGMVTGGTGKKDDVPTLLMGGEYVINKKSVQKYGQSFFESLNRGSVGQMAQGGYFAPGVRGQGNITGKENLLDFATQTATFGGQDIRRSLKGGAGMVSLEPESLRLSNFARFGDSPIVQATQEAKEQAFGLYIDQLGQEKQYQEELANYYRELEEAQSAKKKAEKDKKKQFLISLATAAVSAGLSYGFGGGAKTGAKAGGTRFSGGRIRGVSERPFGSSSSRNLPAGYSSAARYSSTANEFQSFPTQFEPDIPLSPLSNFSNYGGPQLLPPLSFDWRNWMMGITSSLANGGPKIAQPIQANLRQKTIFPYSNSFYNSYVRRNSGGAISGSGDSVPVMASKGEFMLNSSAAKKIGYSNLYAMNNGAIPSGSSDNSAIVVAKLDELIEKTVGASNVTVNVTISKDGETSSSQEGGDQNNKQLAEKLRGAVVQIMQAEQRPGGVLSKR